MKNVATVEMNHVNAMSNVTRINPATVLRRMALRLAALFSFILGEKVGAAFSLCLLNTMIAGTCAFLFGGAGIIIQLLLILWFAVAVWQVKTTNRKV